MEGDIFKACSFNCTLIKKVMLDELLYAVHNLEAHTMLSTDANVIVK